MTRRIRTIGIAIVGVLALAAAGYAATSGIVARTASRATVVAPARQKHVQTVRVVRANGVVKRIVTVRTGATITTTTTYVKNGKRYVVTVVRKGGKVVRQTTKVRKIPRR